MLGLGLGLGYGLVTTRLSRTKSQPNPNPNPRAAAKAPYNEPSRTRTPPYTPIPKNNPDQVRTELLKVVVRLACG